MNHMKLRAFRQVRKAELQGLSRSEALLEFFSKHPKMPSFDSEKAYAPQEDVFVCLTYSSPQFQR